MDASVKPIVILLVEDSPTDKLIAVEALAHARVVNSLHTVDDGVEAMAFLRKEGKYAGAPRPDLILLDLNLPKKDGREVLEEIKEDPRLRMIPVVILTTSQADDDVAKAYGHHASAFVAKPVDFEQFSKVVRSIENFWFEVVTFPPSGDYVLDSQPASGSPPRAAATSGGPMRALLVEDSDTDYFLIRSALVDEPNGGFEVTRVVRMSDAKALLRNERFDVVLADLGLPDIQGLDTVRAMRQACPSTPVVVLTSLNDTATGMAALREGAQDYLIKDQAAMPMFGRAVRYAVERWRMELELRQSQRMQAVGQLAGGIAHDFNNLLTVITAHADLVMGEESANSQTRESIQEIARAAQRAAALTRQLLTFSRRQPIQAAPVDLNEVIGCLHKLLDRLLGESIRLELRLAAEPAPVIADVGMIEQVVMNLALNARDAMPSGGKLTIVTSIETVSEADARRTPGATPGRLVCISISDTGVGMSDEVMSHLFEPFFTTKEVGKGTGLGLATVYGIVNQHRGWIRVASTVGKGSVFEVFFPPAEDIKSRSHAPEAVAPPPSTGPRPETILVVEDERQLREMTSTVLKRKGYRVIEAANGIEALTLWRDSKWEIDMILTDLVMPDGISGRELVKHLSSERPNLKVLYTSGYSLDLVDGDRSFILPGNFISKPFRLADLTASVRRILDE